MANNIRYKLRNIWSRLDRSGKNEFNSYEEFKAWSLENGYKPWKNITLLDESGPYSSDNCIWEVTTKGAGACLSLNDDLSPDNISKNIRDMSTNVVDIKVKVDSLLSVCDDLHNYNLIDPRSYMDLRRNLDLIKERLLDTYHTIDEMDVSTVTDCDK